MTHMTPRILFALLVALAARLDAQATREQTDTQFARLCHEAALAFGGGDSVPGWARGRIAQCPAAGSPVVAALWRTVADDTPALNELIHWTESIATVEVLSAALAALQDPVRAMNVRLAALSVSVGSLDPDRSVLYDATTAGDPAARLVLRSHPRAHRLTGLAHELHASEVIRAIKSLVASDLDPTVRAAALALWGEIADELPTLAGIEPGVVEVEALCEQRFRITNKAPVALSLRVVKDGSPGGWARARPSEPTIARYSVRDSLVVTFAGRRLAAARPDHSKCP